MLKTTKTNDFIFKLILLLVFKLVSFPVLSQVKNSSFSFFNSPDQIEHSSIQPFLECFQKSIPLDSLSRRNWMGRKWFDESLFEFSEDEVNLLINPLFNFSFGKQIYSTDLIYNNVRGIQISGDISSKISFETRIYENQFLYPEYLRIKSKQRANHENTIDAIAFGVGRAKNFKENSLDASLANGYLSFSPRTQLNYQIGHGRHFFGSGYRSLVLSDYAPDYPYISGQYYFFDNKILYKHVNSWLSNLSRLPNSSTVESLFVPKSLSFNQISFQPNKEFSFSLFEGAIYKTFDFQNGRINPKFSFYSPILGSSILDKDETVNSLYGINLSYQAFKQWNIYHQIAVNSTKKLGIQMGLKCTTPFNLNKSFFNIEFNSIPNAFYSLDSSNLNQKYSHLGHELAHPVGSGFREILLKGQFSFNRIFLRFNYNYFRFDKFINEITFANQVFSSIEEINFQSLAKNDLIFLNTSLGLYFNSSTNMEISVGHVSRYFNGNVVHYLIMSWRTFLKNDYFDQ